MITEKVQSIVAAIQKRLPHGARPQVALVLGSGLGEYAETLESAIKIPYTEVGLPASGVPGHAGQLVYGIKKGCSVLVMQGRLHMYEGYDAQTVVLPIRTLVACGCKTVVLTNAAGGIQAGLRPGQLVVLYDHINFTGRSPLQGPNEPALGTRFPDMSAVYDPIWQKRTHDIALALRLRVGSGVYAGVLGPQYETPAEIQMLARMGADVVGMSTVMEAIAARHMGARVLGISCVTNLAAGISKTPLRHEEIMEITAQAKDDFISLLDGLMVSWAAEESK